MLGLPPEEALGDDQELRARWFDSTVRATLRMLEAGVTISVSDWSGWSPLEREAAARAGYRLRVELAVANALASSGRTGELMAPIDGGQAAVSEALDDFTAELTATAWGAE